MKDDDQEKAPTDRTRVRRLPARGDYDRNTINAILDEALICHVGFVSDGQPFVIPTGFARVDDVLYIHGSSASRMLRQLSKGVEVCVTVTLLDGMVLARSAFHHSMNYRSVVVLGRALLVEDEDEKNAALKAFTDHMIPGRWDDIRWPNELELKATSVLKLSLDEASAKIRTGGPKDDDEDMEMDVWSGVIPIKLTSGEPVRDEHTPEDKPEPSHVADFKL